MYSPETVARGRLLNMRVNDEEFERLNALASHYGLNVSGVIRMLAKREAVALGVEKTGTTVSKARPKRKS